MNLFFCFLNGKQLDLPTILSFQFGFGSVRMASTSFYSMPLVIGMAFMARAGSIAETDCPSDSAHGCRTDPPPTNPLPCGVHLQRIHLRSIGRFGVGKGPGGSMGGCKLPWLDSGLEHVRGKVGCIIPLVIVVTDDRRPPLQMSDTVQAWGSYRASARRFFCRPTKLQGPWMPSVGPGARPPRGSPRKCGRAACTPLPTGNQLC